MKCVCGYKHANYTNQDGFNESVGDEPFKEITIFMESIYCDIKDDKRDTQYVYACPKCGTLKINL